MNRVVRRWMSCVVLIAASIASASAWADVPGRVGRIAFLQGDVQTYAESDPEWRAAYVNQPVTSHQSVFVGDGGRAEVSVGSTTVALDGASQIDVQQLDDSTFDVHVVRGRAAFTVRRIDSGDRYAVAIPGADFELLKPGRYRIDALDGDSGLSVFSGQASLATERGPILVNAGSALRAVSTANAAPTFETTTVARAELDDWVVAREARFRDSQTARFVSPNMTGYEELDANGRWASEPDLGPVWYPTTYVDAGWVPYRHGRWAYVAPWGYTWVDDAPWGFAPFHYGRWVQVGGRWGWCPGAYVTRPVYAPALVGFYGGSSASLSIAAGGGPAVGWYPLAPWQRYAPHYTQNVTYINRVNNIAIAEPPPRWRGGRDGHDWNRFHGGTVVPQAAFTSQRSISRIATTSPDDFARRAAPLPVGALPRPQALPAAIRTGPPQAGDERRDWRGGPREGANRPFDRDRAPQVVAPSMDRARLDDDAAARFERQRQVEAQRLQQERGRAFEERRARDQARITSGVPQPNVDPNGGVPAPRFESRMPPRVQPSLRGDGDSNGDVGRAALERANRDFDRHREVRGLQRPPVPQPQPVMPQVERPQAVERAAIGRPQAVQQPAPPQPAAIQPQRHQAPGQREMMRQRGEGNGFDRGGPGRER